MNVYFVRTTSGEQLLKIGKANNVAKRMESLRTDCPYGLEVVGTIRCRSDAHARTVEKEIHRICLWARVRGEWFKYNWQMRAGVAAMLEGSTDFLYENARRGWNEARGAERAA